MPHFLHQLLEALLMAAAMFWKVGWSLVLGFLVSGMLQALVSKDGMRRALGRTSLRSVALAAAGGIASSSCSYASAAISRTLFKKGAALVPSLTFLVASTNLVIELGIMLYLLMGWQFTAGEWLGGLVLIAIMSALIWLTYPRRLAEEARNHLESGGGQDHGGSNHDNRGVLEKLMLPETRIAIAQNFLMDWRMLWKDLLLGFLIAGALAVFVPDGVWQALFLKGSGAWLQVPVNALLGPIVGVLSFVCSIGNVPMAAILWGSGVSFGGVLAFLYSDLIVLPLLDVYRRYYGWKMAAYIGGILYTTMVISAIIMDLIFNWAGWIPARSTNIRVEMMHFSFDYTFWLNLAFGAIAAFMFLVARRYPMTHGGCEHHHGGHGTAELRHAGLSHVEEVSR